MEGKKMDMTKEALSLFI